MKTMYFVLKMFVCYLFSDGMSRSGVFITCMSEIEGVKVEGAVDIFQSVKAARAQRPHMVFTSVSLFFQLGVQYRLKSSVLHGGKV